MIELIEAETYIDENILHADEWRSADDQTKQRAIRNSFNILSRSYQKFSTEAICLQALWLLRIDDSVRRTEQGATTINVDGITVSFAQINRTIAPDVIQILGRRIGRSTGDRRGYIVSSDNYVKGVGDWVR